MVNTVYRYGSSLAQSVDVTSNDARDLGNVDITGINSAVDITDDSQRDLGQTWVQNQVDVDLAAQTGPDLATQLDAALAANSADELRVTSPDGVTFDVSASSALPVHNPNPLSTTVLDTTDTVIDPAKAGAQGNWPNGNDISYSTSGTTVETLPANVVPDGVTVVVQAKRDNSSNIAVGVTASPAVTLAGGQTLSYDVTDTSQIRVQAGTSGDGVNVTHEVN